MAPDRGRSALDAIMLMGNGIEFMREHVPSNTRMHYIINNGGVAPNVVPDTAEMYLVARSPSSVVLAGIWARILKVAQGAAMMTETTVDVKIVSADASIVTNDVLAKQLNRTGTSWRLRIHARRKALRRRVAEKLAAGRRR